MFVFVVIVGNIVTAKSSTELTQGLELANKKRALAATMNNTLLESAIAMRNLGLQEDVAGVQREEARVKALQKRYGEARDQLAQAGLSEVETAVIESIERLGKEVQKPLVEVIDHAINFNSEGAAKVISTRIEPLTQKSLAEVARLFDAQEAAFREVLTTTVAASKYWQQLFLMLGIVAVGSGAVCAWLLSRSITRPLAQAVSVAEALARGDLTQAPEASERDEAGQLLNALGTSISQLRGITARVQEFSGAIAQASNQIAAGNADLSHRTEEQASSLEETALPWKS